MSAELPRAGLIAEGVHRYPVRVYYEDTDAAGIVYYANYLKFIERGRTEMMRLLGVEHSRQRAEAGLAFVVRRVTAEYLAPARLDDALVVVTRVVGCTGAALDLVQEVRRDDVPLVRVDIGIACVGQTGRPTRIPPALRAALQTLNPSNDRMVTAHAR